MEAFFAMGKYAAYVWPAYGISLLGLGLAIGFTLSAYARAKKRLAALESGK
ncbi:MAG: heme exporter protein CcmD [Proteobacteria bacterium]|nr:heme exporter protein CcmD [Pseudomonadota bacterium]